MTPVEVKEVVYQAVPYVGMGRAYDFVHATNDVLTERGVQLPLAGQSTTTRETRAAAGRAVQDRIVGADQVAARYANALADEQHIQRWLSAHCFGDHYTRTGLDLPTRELVTLALLIALGGADAQVRGHVAANLNVGNDRASLIDVVTQLLPFIGYPRTLNALAAIDEVAPAPTNVPAEHISSLATTSPFPHREESSHALPTARPHRRPGQPPVPGGDDVRPVGQRRPR